jgi:hypothetical protein
LAKVIEKLNLFAIVKAYRGYKELGDVMNSFNSNEHFDVDFSEKVKYQGMIFTYVPNMVRVMEYFRASWTLRDEEADKELLPWIDTDAFNPGYMLRSLHLFPKRGSKADRQHPQDYWLEKDTLPVVNLDDNFFVYR